jgi:predicted ribosome quality control (RQC) complex YloA/Tae2 family protein
MDQVTLAQIVAELNRVLTGRFLGKVFQLSPSSIALDFGVRENGYLFLSIDPSAPRAHLIKRTSRELQKSSLPLSPFTQAVQTKLRGASLQSITQDKDERVLRFCFAVTTELGEETTQVLVTQLTGRSANLLLLDDSNQIQQVWRVLAGNGQEVGDVYRPPPSMSRRTTTQFSVARSQSISEAVDKHYETLEAQNKFAQLAGEQRADLRKEISKLKKLQKNLKQDLTNHGDPEQHKRLGDLLLANVGTAKRKGNTVFLTDYYVEAAPSIQIEVDENQTLQQAATAAFARFTKAKRAVKEISQRLQRIDIELKELTAKQQQLEVAIRNEDEDALKEFAGQKSPQQAVVRQRKKSPSFPGARRYRSSDGYEVLVGKTARNNDQLTFKVARPNDLWLHAADYPGSHVVVRSSNNQEIPHRTILEAAQLAAKFSQAGNDSKVDIHYTRRKFLSKPKGAAPGLVRLSSFKTITVEPGENIERIK